MAAERALGFTWMNVVRRPPESSWLRSVPLQSAEVVVAGSDAAREQASVARDASWVGSSAAEQLSARANTAGRNSLHRGFSPAAEPASR